MPEWNLVAAREASQNASSNASSKFASSNLTLLTRRSAGVCGLALAVFAMSTQVGCNKLRSGGLDRNILRSSEAVPSEQAQPANATAPARFTNDPTNALSELNDAYKEFDGSSFDKTASEDAKPQDAWGDAEESQSQANDARIIETSQQTFDTQEKGITLVAIQPPAPPIRDSFEATQPDSSVNFDRVLLGGVDLSEIEPLNPAKVIKQCDHVECDCMKEKLKPVLPFAQPIHPPAISSQVPPSELVSQPLAPIMFDESTRVVQKYDEAKSKQNSLRLIQEYGFENSAPLEDKLEMQVAEHEPTEIAEAQARPIHFQPTVDPELGRASKLPPGCLTCESDHCLGDCKNSTRRDDANKLRPVVGSEEITSAFAQAPVTLVNEVPEVKAKPRDAFAIKGEFMSTPEISPVKKADYSEFTTQDWTEIFGPPAAPVVAIVQPKNRRLASRPKPTAVISPPTVQGDLVPMNEERIEVVSSNDFAPHTENVELATAEVAGDLPNWEPPKHTNFSPIPPSDNGQPKFIGVAIENAARRGATTPFPVVNTRVEIPVKREVVVEVVDNTVPWSVKLAETVDNVRRQRDAESDPMARNGIEVNLRLLEVLQRQMTTVEESQHSMPNSERQYWQHQLDAIALMLPVTANSDASDLDRHNTAYETLEHLRKAVERLESIAELKVSAGRFCTEISGFGKFKPFASSVFKPGQKTLVYCEVENYLSNARRVDSEPSYHTSLRGSYVIYDQQGRVVQQSEYPVVNDVASKRRRDFYMYFPIQIGKLAAGNYKLELMVEDLSSNKTAALKPGMRFQIR